MTRPVKISTPVPSLEEFGESLGLSKARRKSIDQMMIVDSETAAKMALNALKHYGSLAKLRTPAQREEWLKSVIGPLRQEWALPGGRNETATGKNRSSRRANVRGKAISSSRNGKIKRADAAA